ncbi:MAG: hypothetical protein H6825_04665 [Planctomycetes bacterium]|nr:hypothetical protein [Planctomycetota bacterium]
MSPRAATAWGLAYAALVLALLAVRAAPFADAPLRAGRLVELVAPDALSPLPGDGNLLVPLLLGADGGAPGADADGRLFTGLLPLLFALLAFVWTSSRASRVARAALLVAGALAFSGVATHPWLPPLGVALLAPLAGLGLAALLRRDDDRRGAGAPLLVGTLSVLLAGALGAAAAEAGAHTETALVQPIVERLLARGCPTPDAAQVHLTAGHLLRLADEAALASFAAMVALLLLLKSRRVPALLLVFAVTAADLLREPLAAALRGG